MANSTVCQSKWKPIVEPRRAKPKTCRQAPTHWLKFYEEASTRTEQSYVLPLWKLRVGGLDPVKLA